MTIDEARDLLKRYQAGNVGCVSTYEWAQALDVVLRHLDGRPLFLDSEKGKH